MTMGSKEMKSKLAFEVNEDPEIVRFTHLENGLSWKTEFLSLEEYADREDGLGRSKLGQMDKNEEALKEYEHSKHLGIKYFVLKDLELPATSKTSQIVASCETMNRVGYVMKPGSSDVIEVLVPCIGAVFCLKHHRGKGYARYMINMLNEHYDAIAMSSEDPFLRYMFIHLYSEVGEYYSKSGYVSYHVPVNEIFNLEGLKTKYCGNYDGVDFGAIRDLGYDNYKDLVEVEKAQFLKQIQCAHDADGGERYKVSVAPSLENYMWFEDRDIFVSRKFTSSPPTRFGAALADGSHMIWHHHWTAGSLILVKVQILGDDKDAKLSKLIGEAIEECGRSKLTHIEFWEDELPAFQFTKLHEITAIVETGHHLKKINSSLSAIRLSKHYEDETGLWLNNTKFCWF